MWASPSKVLESSPSKQKVHVTSNREYPSVIHYTMYTFSLVTSKVLLLLQYCGLSSPFSLDGLFKTIELLN